MQPFTPYADATPFVLILLGAVFVHVCFQLSVSVLTLLSSHTIGRRMGHTRLMNLSMGYVAGVAVAVTLLQLAAMAGLRLLMNRNPELASVLTFTTVPLIALLVVIFYYRRGKGTQLWLPRSAAAYVTGRAKRTKSVTEAFGLGLTTAVTELPFALAPLLIVGFTFQGFMATHWLALAVLYGLAVSFPLVFVALYLSSGHTISAVQRWREGAKGYLKWTSAATLLLLCLYVAVLQSGGVS